MKPFFGIDITADKTNKTENARVWMIRETDPALLQKNEDIRGRGITLMKKTVLPLPLRIIRYACILTAATLFYSLFRAFLLEDNSLGELYGSVPHYFWIGAGSLILWGILYLAGRRRETDITEGRDNERLLRELEQNESAILRQLNVPQDAAEADILAFVYKEKNGVIHPAGAEMFTPVAAHLFLLEDGLYIATLQYLYRIPRDSFRAIRTVRKRICLTAWNKDTPPGEDKSRPGKVWVDNLSRIWTKPYGILEWEHNGQIWEIYFPYYDLDVFTSLTGVKAV